MSHIDLKNFPNLAQMFPQSNFLEFIKYNIKMKQPDSAIKLIDSTKDKPEQLFESFQYANFYGDFKVSKYIQQNLPKEEMFNPLINMQIFNEIAVSKLEEKDKKLNETNKIASAKIKINTSELTSYLQGLREIKDTYSNTKEIKDYIETKVPYLLQAAIGGDIEIFNNLNKAGMIKNLNDVGIIGFSRKHKNAIQTNLIGTCAFYGQLAFLKYILNKIQSQVPIDVNYKTVEKKSRAGKKNFTKEFMGYTPAMLCLVSKLNTDEESLEFLRFLHANGADFESLKDSNGENILHISTRANKKNCIKYFIEELKLQNLLSEPNKEGQTPAVLANSLHENLEVAQYFVNKDKEGLDEIEKNIQELIEGSENTNKKKSNKNKRIKGHRGKKKVEEEKETLGGLLNITGYTKDNNLEKGGKNKKGRGSDSHKLKNLFDVFGDNKKEDKNKDNNKDNMEDKDNDDNNSNDSDNDNGKYKKQWGEYDDEDEDEENNNEDNDNSSDKREDNYFYDENKAHKKVRNKRNNNEYDYEYNNNYVSQTYGNSNSKRFNNYNNNSHYNNNNNNYNSYNNYNNSYNNYNNYNNNYNNYYNNKGYYKKGNNKYQSHGDKKQHYKIVEVSEVGANGEIKIETNNNLEEYNDNNNNKKEETQNNNEEYNNNNNNNNIPNNSEEEIIGLNPKKLKKRRNKENINKETKNESSTILNNTNNDNDNNKNDNINNNTNNDINQNKTENVASNNNENKTNEIGTSQPISTKKNETESKNQTENESISIPSKSNPTNENNQNISSPKKELKNNTESNQNNNNQEPKENENSNTPSKSSKKKLEANDFPYQNNSTNIPIDFNKIQVSQRVQEIYYEADKASDENSQSENKNQRKENFENVTPSSQKKQLQMSQKKENEIEYDESDGEEDFLHEGSEYEKEKEAENKLENNLENKVENNKNINNNLQGSNNKNNNKTNTNKNSTNNTNINTNNNNNENNNTNDKSIPATQQNINDLLSLANEELETKNKTIHELSKKLAMTDLTNIKNFSVERLKNLKEFYQENLKKIDEALLRCK